MKKSIYYLNIFVLVANLIFFYMNFTVFGDLYSFFVMPFVTLGCFIASKYIKKESDISSIERYVQNGILFVNIIVSIVFIIIFSLLVAFMAQNITH